MQKTQWYKKHIPDFSLDAVFVGSFYTSEMQRKIHRFKFVHNYVDRVYFESLIRDIIDEFSSLDRSKTVIVFPPISLYDRCFRGPNHAKILAKMVAKSMGVTRIVCPFRKPFFAGHQSRRHKQDRMQIPSLYSFSGTKELIEGYDIILVDDLITTGYTAHALGALLKHAGAESITGLFLASEKV